MESHSLSNRHISHRAVFATILAQRLSTHYPELMSLTQLIQDAKNQVGELILTGVTGHSLSADHAKFIREARIGGVVYFAHNYDNPVQIAEFSNQIQECRRDLPLFIAVDHEGGKVQRFRKGFTRIPDARTLAQNGSPAQVFSVAEIIAKELAAVGVNVNFCAIADINTNPSNPVIGDRAFGDTEETVSAYVTAMVRGHLTQGVLPCVKHFPGHGDTHLDSHFALPTVNTSLDILKQREFKPFLKAFKSKCPLVMSAHIINPNIDSLFPATLSSKTLKGILRQELRFSKVIISDDMEMKAIADHYGIDDAPVLALEAGCDLLCYRSEDAAKRAHEALIRALDSGKLKPETVFEAVARVLDLKKEHLVPFQVISPEEAPKKVGLPEYTVIADLFKPA